MLSVFPNPQPLESALSLPLPARTSKPRPRWPLITLSVLGIALAAVMPVPFNLVVGVAPLAVALCLRWPLAALYALTFSVPFQDVRAITVGGLQLTLTEILIGLAAVAWCTAAALRGYFEMPALPWRPALLVFGGAMLLSVSQASSIVLSVKELFKWAEMALTYVMVLSLVRTPREVPRLLVLLIVAGMVEALVGFGQVLIHGGGVFHAAGVLRAAGTFDQPNPFAGFLNMSLPFSLAILLLGLAAYTRLARWAAAITGVAVLVSLSRGAWLAILAAGLTMAWLTRPGWRKAIRWGLGLLALVIIASVIGVLPGSVAESVASLFGLSNVDVANPTPANWSVAERVAHWLAGLSMFASHPILGVGIGNYAAVYAQYQVAPIWQYALGHAHNYYINMAAEAGVIGLAAYLFFLGSTLWLCIRLWRTARTTLGRVIGLGALGVIVTTAVQGIFDNVFVHGMEVQVALVLALVALAERYETEEVTRSSGRTGSGLPAGWPE